MTRKLPRRCVARSLGAARVWTLAALMRSEEGDVYSTVAPSASQDLHHEANVADGGHVLQVTVVGCEKSGCHGVDRGVLVAADPHLAFQAVPPSTTKTVSSHSPSNRQTFAR